MADTISNKFILALDPARDRLYSLALAKGSTPAKAESVLQQSVRTLFPEFVKDPYLDISSSIEKALAHLPGPPAPASTEGGAQVLEHMPADVWARLAAAVQLTAAKAVSAPGAPALNPDSVLLSPDPLLAPKRPTPFDDDDLSEPSRFLFTSTIAVIIGIGLTIYILTRPAAQHPATQPSHVTTSPATSNK